MTLEEFAQAAQGLRRKLVKLTVMRGHEHYDADDIVQCAIVNALGSAHKCRTKTDVERLLRTVTFRDSANLHRDLERENKDLLRLNDYEDSNDAALVHDDQIDLRDLKLDVQKALKQLSGDDRELARLTLIEGFTYKEAQALFSDRFTSETELKRHMLAVVLPSLRTSLAAYRKEAT